MLVPARKRRVKRKTDWFPTKLYPHFDFSMNREDAEQLVTNPDAVATHPFLPLISFEKRQRRFKSSPAGPKSTTKIRKLAYASNRDNYIYSYYAEVLGKRYEELIIRLGLGDVVIAYRKGGSNIEHARRVFEQIRSRTPCTALTFDISSFFDRIDHATLKKNWALVLGVETLPKDQYNVFRALTRFSKIKRAELLLRLGLARKTKDKNLPRPICPVTTFRRLRSDKALPRLVEVNNETYGIP